MRTRFAFLSKFAAKFIEVAGAGLASALCAYFLGQIERPPPPPATVVQMSPVNAERTRMARDDHPRLGDSARKETDSQPDSLAAAPTAVSAPRLAWRSRHPASHPILRLRRRGKASKRQPAMMEFWHRIAARRNGRCSRDLNKSRPGSCPKTTGFLANFLGRQCRSVNSCRVRCRRRPADSDRAGDRLCHFQLCR